MITNLMLAALIGAGLQSASPGPLSLAEAIHIARQQPDPSVSRYDAAARAARHRGEAAAVLPDPVVSAAIMNLPAARSSIIVAQVVGTKVTVMPSAAAKASIRSIARPRYAPLSGSRTVTGG